MQSLLKILRPMRWLVVAAALAGASCSLYREDRCYVEDAEYDAAYKVFVESGSLDVVRRRMEDIGWERCKMNEVMYRLEKEFEIVPVEEPPA